MQTIWELLTEIKSEFGKTSPRLELQFESKINARLREICSDYDYWFLRVDPGAKVPATYAVDPTTATFGLDRWIDQGWFITEPGREYYPIAIASTGTPDAPATFDYAEARKLNFVKRFSLSGSFQGDLGIVGPNQFFSHPGDGYRVQEGTPSVATIQMMVDRKMYIRLNPVPQDTYLMQVSYQLGLPPWIGEGDERYNWMSWFYPRALLCLAGLVYASWFHEAKQAAFWKMELFGDSDDGKSRSDIPNSGLVGKMKRDTDFRNIGEVDEMPYYASQAESVGRDGIRGRYPGDPFYYR